MKYAPIAIATLNRDKHLEKCLDALVSNRHFKETKIYISVDYPPNEKYEEGYEKVKQLLIQKYGKYENINIIYHEKNLGPIENYAFIKDKIFCDLDYKNIIILEDDSEVSKNFLDYCNKLLECYENDSEIVGICGSSQTWYEENFKEKDTRNIDDRLRKMPMVWHGYATWKKDYYMLKELCNNNYFQNIRYNIKKLIKLHKKSRYFFYRYIENICWKREEIPWYKGKIVPIDYIWGLYMMVDDKYMIFPTINKVRDWGMDGSGKNFKEKSKYCNDISGMYLDEKDQYTKIELDPYIDYSEIKKYDSYSDYRLKKVRFKAIIKLCLSYFKYPEKGRNEK